MSHVVYYVAASVDGFIATPDGGVGWLDRFQGADTDSVVQEVLEKVQESAQDFRFLGCYPEAEVHGSS